MWLIRTRKFLAWSRKRKGSLVMLLYLGIPEYIKNHNKKYKGLFGIVGASEKKGLPLSWKISSINMLFISWEFRKLWLKIVMKKIWRNLILIRIICGCIIQHMVNLEVSLWELGKNGLKLAHSNKGILCYRWICGIKWQKLNGIFW